MDVNAAIVLQVLRIQSRPPNSASTNVAQHQQTDMVADALVVTGPSVLKMGTAVQHQIVPPSPQGTPLSSKTTSPNPKIPVLDASQSLRHF